jgi:uncharacterized protein (DUF736 family)
MENNKTQNKNTELGALWKKKSKSGMSFLSGYVKVDDLGLEKEIKVVVFANNNKSKENAPDYRIYVSKPLDSGSSQSGSSQSESVVSQPKTVAKTPVKEVKKQVVQDSDEDIL